MKIFLKISSIIVLFIGLSACCSKKGSCPILEFKQIELLNFDANEVNDSLGFVIYKSGTNFSQIIDSQSVKATGTDDPKKFILDKSALSADYDYAVYVLKIGKVYRVNNYRTKKIACGKCFMRSNNQYGYELTTYAVNGNYKAYEGNISITK